MIYKNQVNTQQHRSYRDKAVGGVEDGEIYKIRPDKIHHALGTKKTVYHITRAPAQNQPQRQREQKTGVFGAKIYKTEESQSNDRKRNEYPPAVAQHPPRHTLVCRVFKAEQPRNNAYRPALDILDGKEFRKLVDGYGSGYDDDVYHFSPSKNRPTVKNSF